MKSFKKQFAVALIAVLAVGAFVGCNKSPTDTAADNAQSDMKSAADKTGDAVKEGAEATKDAITNAAITTKDAVTNAADNMTSTNK
jgi:hypothetical protein